jgi:hypothetical protein
VNNINLKFIDMPFIGSLIGAAANFLKPVVGGLIGQGVNYLGKFLGGAGGDVVDTVGSTGTQIASNLGQMGLKKISSVFGNETGEIVRGLGNQFLGSVQNRFRERACEEERMRILELEEELYNLKRTKFQ